MVFRSARSFEWTLATTMSSRSSISGVLVQLTGFQDVHFDAGQQPEAVVPPSCCR